MAEDCETKRKKTGTESQAAIVAADWMTIIVQSAINSPADSLIWTMVKQSYGSICHLFMHVCQACTSESNIQVRRARKTP